MCRELNALRQSVTGWARGFDARSLTPAEAGVVVEACSRMEASLASAKALAAARGAEGSSWKHEGYRSPAEQLAQRTGMSPSSARRALDTGRRLAEQPDVASAALSGELSLEQAGAVSEGVRANPSKARELIDKARHLSLPELNDEVARTKAAATDLEARRCERHLRRSFSRYTDRDGALIGRLYGHPEDGATIWRMIDPVRRRLNMLRKQAAAGSIEAVVEPLEALDYDALKTLADLATGLPAELTPGDLIDLGLFPALTAAAAGHNAPPDVGRNAHPGQATARIAGRLPGFPHPVLVPPPVPPPGQTELLGPAPAAIPPDDAPSTGGPPGSSGPRDPAALPDPRPDPGSGPAARAKKVAGSPVKVIFRIDLAAFLRGAPLEGELCDLAGYGPVPVSTIRALLHSGQTFIAAALTRSERVIGVYHQGRRPNAAQRTALELTQPTCSVLGCPAKAGLQDDHRIDWASTRITALDLIDRLCPHHHNKKTRDNWQLVPGTGKRAFVPPHDPRHPDQVRAATS